LTDRKKRAIIVGIGGHAHSWRKVLELHPDWELAAIVDTDTEKLESAPKIWGVDEDEAFTSVEEAFQYGEGPYDLAILVTPIYTHHVLALEAMELGLNVICEKNLCSTIEQARMLVKATDAHPELCTATGTQTRYFPKNWAVRKYFLEHEEQLGKMTSVNFECLYNWGKSRFGWRRWLADIYMEDMAPHHFDYLRFLTGMDVVEVKGVNFKPSFSKFKGSSTTFAIFALATPENYTNKDNWIYATYRGDWQKKGNNYSKFELNCEGGDVILLEEKKTKSVTATIYDDDEGFKFHTEDVPLTPDVLYNEDEFTDQILILDQMKKGIDSKGKDQPQTNFKDAIKSFAISRGIVESSKTGNAVYLPDYWKNLGI
jgi:predicted dehydrogenase